jgi:iron complex transport system substrate-binding protein
MAALTRFRVRFPLRRLAHPASGRRASLLRSMVAVLLIAIVATGCGAAGAAGTLTPGPSPTVSVTSAPSPVPTPTSTPAPTFPMAITDDEGTSVTIPAPPQRIVSLTPAATETLFAIGAGDRVVAKVEDITPYPPEADSLPVVATYQGVDVEKIVSLRADLVIAGGLGFTPPDAVAQLRNLGIPVIVLYATSVDQALAGIREVGVASGAPSAADALATSMRAEIDRLAGLVAGLPRPTTFYEIDATTDIYTVPADSLYAELLRLAGADPITTDSSYQISLEQVIAANPAVILLGDGGYTKPADVEARPGWGGIQAVVDGRIVAVDDTLITRPGPRLPLGLRALIAAVHPEVTP